MGGRVPRAAAYRTGERILDERMSETRDLNWKAYRESHGPDFGL
jgi:hypothetical protein